MSAPRSKSTKELLKAAKLPERSVEVCLRGDLVADIEELERQLRAALEDRRTNGRLGTKTPSQEIADQIEAKREEMAESMVVFRVRALKSAEWRALLAKHTADDDVDILPLMGEAIPASVIEPDDMDADDWEAFNETVSSPEMGKLINAVWQLNMQGVNVPKSPLASALTRTSDDG